MKIFCVGRNYVAHAQELGNEVPDEPIIFMKPKSALLQAHTPFYYPEFTNELHYECELVLRISKNGKYIQERFANKYYDALTVGIDFTARDIKNKKDINFCLYKNKELVQQGASGLMINNFDNIVSYISNYFSVNIGDLVFTGTPAGVGECVVGDELEGFMEDDSMFELEVK
jgi:2-keto-4-pentenoate hydratase/2-oxohepta-3-ene-1,7-dioic acid hydratase in catechol pathway